MIINLPEINHIKIKGEYSSLYSSSFLVTITLEDAIQQLTEQAIGNNGKLQGEFISSKHGLLNFLMRISCFNSQIKSIFYEYYNNIHGLMEVEYFKHCFLNYGNLPLPVERRLTGKTFKINNIDYIYFFRNLVYSKEPLIWWNNTYLSKKYSSVAIKFYAWMWYCIDDYIEEYNPKTLILFSTKELVKGLEILFKKAVTKYGYDLQVNKSYREDFDLKSNFLRHMAPKKSEYMYELKLEK